MLVLTSVSLLPKKCRILNSGRIADGIALFRKQDGESRFGGGSDSGLAFGMSDAVF